MYSSNNKSFVILFFFIFNLACFSPIKAQNDDTKIDSLKQKLNLKNADTTKISAYLALAGIYETIDLSVGSKYMDSACVALKKTNYKKGLSIYLMKRIRFQFLNLNFTKAIILSKQAQNYFLKEKDIARYLIACQYEAYSLSRNGQSDQAIALLNATVNKYKKAPYHKQIGHLYFELGQQYLHKSMYTKSLANLKTSIFHFNKTGDKNNNIEAYRLIQYTYQQIGDLKKARSIAAYILQNNTNQNNRSRSIDLVSLGQIYYQMGAYTAAEQLQLKAYKLAEKIDLDLSISILSELTSTYILTKNYDAIILLNTKELSNSNHNLSNIARIYANLIKAYVAKKQYIGAKQYIDKILMLIKKDKNQASNLDVIDLYGNISINENKLGNYKAAYYFLNLSDSLYRHDVKIERSSKIIEQLAIFDTENKEARIKKDHIIKQNQELKIQRSRDDIYKLITSLLVGMIFIIILIVAYIKVDKIKKELFNKNVIISNQQLITENLNISISKALRERELLLKEIHHRVKNNLQIIMSLLSIQAKEGAEKNDINYFLEKSQSRILSISLIHQNLYENENLQNIDYKLYLNDMCKNLDSVLNIYNKNIRFIINVDAVFLDLQTAIPLGLILNELISNSYKHAFPTEIEGMIEIAIVKNFEKEYILSYSDNGIGIPADNISTRTSLGLELIQLLTKQLGGKLTTKNIKKGVAYQIVFNEVN